jgi:hypothetical protein
MMQTLVELAALTRFHVANREQQQARLLWLAASALHHPTAAKLEGRLRRLPM